MKSTAALISLFFALPAFANSEAKTRVPASVSKVTVKCESPKGFSGLSASVSGDLKLSSLPNGAAKATGKLKISLLDARNPWTEEKQVLGQYDDLTSVGSDRYFHGGATIKDSNDIMEIYVNFTRPEISYVEYSGKTYKMSCK